MGVQGLSRWATREVPPVLFSVFDVDRSNHVCGYMKLSVDILHACVSVSVSQEKSVREIPACPRFCDIKWICE